MNNNWFFRSWLRLWRKTSTFALVELSSKKFIILTEIFNSYISTRLLFFLRNKTRNFLSLGSKFFQLLYFPLHTVVNQTCHSLIVTWNYLFNIYPPPLRGKDFREKKFQLWIFRDLKLKTPIFQETASYGHFGRDIFTWEQPKQLNY